MSVKKKRFWRNFKCFFLTETSWRSLLSSITIVDLWACWHNWMPLHLILETTKTAETSFFFFFYAQAQEQMFLIVLEQVMMVQFTPQRWTHGWEGQNRATCKRQRKLWMSVWNADRTSEINNLSLSGVSALFLHLFYFNFLRAALISLMQHCK